MASHVEGRLLRRSVPYVESWIAELAAKPAAATPAATAPATGPAAPAAPKGKGEKGGVAKGGSAPAGSDGATAMSRCCFAVGKVLEVSRHAESEKLYIEKIDLGAELNAFSNNEPRTILSGLQEFVKEEDFVNRLVLVIANLEPRKIGGVPSAGMVMCASTGDDPHEPASAGQGARQVVLLDIPEGTTIGERVVFDGHDMAYEPVLKKKLAKNFEEVMKDVGTDADGVVCWQGRPFQTSAGVIKASLRNARIS
ncbi:tyrosyl or methionyl-tRNA synthetase-like protein [Novymonas esmeraldas]|uniref:Tyrosyl or methionyl-tRNA synthetase-like protein n=1 Tax=Novymonas esmeraldas TaxID=1808958 RepID=A0AAW0ESP6_9TRYP